MHSHPPSVWKQTWLLLTRDPVLRFLLCLGLVGLLAVALLLLS